MFAWWCVQELRKSIRATFEKNVLSYSWLLNLIISSTKVDIINLKVGNINITVDNINLKVDNINLQSQEIEKNILQVALILFRKAEILHG